MTVERDQKKHKIDPMEQQASAKKISPFALGCRENAEKAKSGDGDGIDRTPPKRTPATRYTPEVYLPDPPDYNALLTVWRVLCDGYTIQRQSDGSLRCSEHWRDDGKPLEDKLPLAEFEEAYFRQRAKIDDIIRDGEQRAIEDEVRSMVAAKKWKKSQVTS